jgi:hypothetical protein
MVSSSTSIAVKSAILVAAKLVQGHRRSHISRKLTREGARPRTRVEVEQIYKQYGPALFRRAYRMKYDSFKKLARKLHHGIREASGKKEENKPRHIPNGPISSSVRLACALCYFAGGSPYNIMTTFQIGFIETINISIWYVVDAINSNKDFNLSYPTNHDEQHAIAEGFRKVSGAGFNCCAGAIDGILIWTHKPHEKDCLIVGCNSGKFLCG